MTIALVSFVFNYTLLHVPLLYCYLRNIIPIVCLKLFSLTGLKLKVRNFIHFIKVSLTHSQLKGIKFIFKFLFCFMFFLMYLFVTFEWQFGIHSFIYIKKALCASFVNTKKYTLYFENTIKP